VAHRLCGNSRLVRYEEHRSAAHDFRVLMKARESAIFEEAN
jgi:hypothetical protein